MFVLSSHHSRVATLDQAEKRVAREQNLRGQVYLVNSRVLISKIDVLRGFSGVYLHREGLALFSKGGFLALKGPVRRDQMTKKCGHLQSLNSTCYNC